MSEACNDGGPAFPILERGGQGLELSCVGMSLRDHFAGLAMQGMLDGVHPICLTEDPLTEISRVAYLQADAMLKAREQTGGAA